LAFWAEKRCQETATVNGTGLDLKVPVSGLKDLTCFKKDGAPDLKADGSLSGKKWGIYGNACRIDKPCVVDEIHLRRFDGLLVNSFFLKSNSILDLCKMLETQHSQKCYLLTPVFDRNIYHFYQDH
jgi:hypothetical protein